MSPRPDIPDHPARILIVDDERPNRELLKVMLTPEGFLPLTAASGEEALAMVAQQPPDLILLDIMMPGMDGLEATALLKRDDATSAIPVIALTALAMKGDEERIRAAGCDGYVAKPMDYQDFLATIAAQLAHA